jgi:hypothetical protein
VPLTIDTSQATAALQRLNTALGRYALETGKSLEDVLAKKGRDLSIKLFQEFRSRQWGGEGARTAATRKSLAGLELRQRTQAGEGTRLRPSLLAAYRAEKGNKIRSALARRSRRRVKLTSGRLTIWQKMVGKETAARARGIGVLAASFLWFRRAGKGKGRRFVRNRTGRPLGFADVGDRSLHIVGLGSVGSAGAGIGSVDVRYGLSKRAIDRVSADTEQYLVDRQAKAFAAAFGNGGRI